MLILSSARIRMRPAPEAPDGRRFVVEGTVQRYRPRIEEFFASLPTDTVTATLRFGRWHLAGELDDFTEQRVRNFLVNNCPLKRG